MRMPTTLAASIVASEVSSPRTTSSRRMRWTGLKKCMPTTRSGRFVAPAISVIDSDEVFVARIVPGFVRASSSANVSVLSRMSSGMASITRSASCVASTSSACAASRARSRTAASSLPAATPLSIRARISASPRARAAGEASYRVVS